ncbi:MAG: hypothetical protein Q4B79_03145 [Moraxella sp.]|uniref:hypothetical protein n=1 Tax=Moraxella sp. TaxID=479 RepID=UPI0026DB353A|nr:hypothetical protein [Moraxella sp.]MDO4449939.1 hypothetical protein [Moraxella sp.]
MKKYLLGACLFLSTQVFAYTGSTLDFTELIFNQAMMESLKENFDGADIAKQQCMGNALKPSMDRLAGTYLDEILTENEQKLMDKFFDTPLGQEMFQELRTGDLRSFGEGIDLDKYNEADYQQYMSVLDKYYREGDVTATLSADEELLAIMFVSLLMCDMMDFEEKPSKAQ